MLETVEAIIGNILCAGDLQMDALVELEDNFGIRIIHCGRSGGPDFGHHLSSSLGPSGGSGGGTASRDTGANNENLSIINRGPMSSIPVFNQLLM